MSRTVKKIQASLDCILDTRMGTLIKIGEVLKMNTLAFDISATEQYYLRDADIFKHPKYGTISNETFQRFKELHAEEIVRSSPKSVLHHFILTAIGMYVQEAATSPTVDEIVFELNLHPYKFTEEEVNNLKAVCRTFVPPEVRIDTCNLSIDKLTPGFVKANYCCIIMYDSVAWANKHAKMISRQFNNVTTFVFPEVLHKRGLLINEQKTFEENKTSIFTVLEQEIYGKFFHSKFIPVANFCVDTPMNKEEYYKISVLSSQPFVGEKDK